MKMENVDIIELFDSYVTLRRLEDNSDCFGNVEYLFNLLEISKEIIKLFDYVYENYCEVV